MRSDSCFPLAEREDYVALSLRERKASLRRNEDASIAIVAGTDVRAGGESVDVP